MAQTPSSLPQQLRVTQLAGVNERVSPSQLKPGEFSYLEGLYPSQNGLLSRVPGKPLLATLPGGTNILQITQTFNSKGDILVHTDSGRFAYTLDELFNRQTIPSLTPGTTPGTNTNEEAMSQAIIVQQEASTVNGGSASGWISGTDPGTSPTGSILNTYYGRRLTAMLINESSTVSSFTNSAGGAGANSTPGQFVLAAGTYRIKADLVIGFNATANVIAGLWNVTDGQFQVQVGGLVPIMATTGFFGVAGAGLNATLRLVGTFTITGNKTFQINQQCSATAAAKLAQFNGNATTITTANTNGFAPTNTYAYIEILKEP